ncbi:hypothetical protein HQ487_01075 [Candidatus Uhrbacteria bacterium]|nr:hypothetical protein [Candidatus Uhrbacteria bacterium]
MSSRQQFPSLLHGGSIAEHRRLVKRARRAERTAVRQYIHTFLRGDVDDGVRIKGRAKYRPITRKDKVGHGPCVETINRWLATQVGRNWDCLFAELTRLHGHRAAWRVIAPHIHNSVVCGETIFVLDENGMRHPTGSAQLPKMMSFRPRERAVQKYYEDDVLDDEEDLGQNPEVTELGLTPGEAEDYEREYQRDLEEYEVSLDDLFWDYIDYRFDQAYEGRGQIDGELDIEDLIEDFGSEDFGFSPVPRRGLRSKVSKKVKAPQWAKNKPRHKQGDIWAERHKRAA